MPCSWPAPETRWWVLPVPVTDPPEAMKSIRLERGLARPSDLAKALDRLGVRQGECFVVMSVRHRDELNQMSWKARTT